MHRDEANTALGRRSTAYSEAKVAEQLEFVRRAFCRAIGSHTSPRQETFRIVVSPRAHALFQTAITVAVPPVPRE